jgi:hypothetical protein
MKLVRYTATFGLGLILLSSMGPLGRTQSTEGENDKDKGVFDQVKLVFDDGNGSGATEPEGTNPDGDTPSKPKAVEPQVKGPVHEAFAEAVTDPQPGPKVDKEPPKDLEELPAADKPEGDDVQWIGGYWDFDQDRKDYLWVSGIYRKFPLRRTWMAGSWVKVEGGWQRQRGIWAPLEQTEITFLPEPPAPKVEENATTAPDDNSFFVAGHWEYKDNTYAWNPGKWVPQKFGWMWIPAHYIWTPCGYVFVPGYWDYLLERRGLLYAPVCIDHSQIGPGFTYCPSYIVHDVCLLDCLFVRPGCGYFFGAYFKQKEYICWPDFCVHHKICDPMFAHYKWHNKNKGNWESNLQALYNGRKLGKIASPPSTFKELNSLVKNFKNKSISSTQLRQNLMIGQAKNLNAAVVRTRTLDQAGVLGQKKFSDGLRDAGKALSSRQSLHLQQHGGSPKVNNGSPLKLDVKRPEGGPRILGSNNNGNRTNNGSSLRSSLGNGILGNGNNGNGNGNKPGGAVTTPRIPSGNGNGNGNNGNGNGNKPGGGVTTPRIPSGNGNGNGNTNPGGSSTVKPRVVIGGGTSSNGNAGGGNNSGNNGGFVPRSSSGNGSGNSGFLPKSSSGNGSGSGNIGGNSFSRRSSSSSSGGGGGGGGGSRSGSGGRRR